MTIIFAYKNVIQNLRKSSEYQNIGC